MKRLGVFLGVIVLVGLVLVPAATADKPLRDFIPADDFVVSGICPFAVSVEILDNKEFGTEFSDGRFLITGKLKVRLTNLSQPSRSIDANISGPGVFTPTPDGGVVIKAEANWLFWFFPGDLGSGSPGVFLLTSGLSYLVIDGSGAIVSFTPARNTTNVCTVLA